jgi:hypothetical protein
MIIRILKPFFNLSWFVVKEVFRTVIFYYVVIQVQQQYITNIT